jgi:hypothetical protein
MAREALNDRRPNTTTMIEFGGEKYFVTVGYYPDDRIGEVFIDRKKTKTSGKLGFTLDGICRDSAVLMSMALQFGTTIETIAHAVTRDDDGTPTSIVGAICDHLRSMP